MAPSKDRSFVVHMYESEYRQIQAWVAKHEHIETGGDLFGLWADDHTAVVQLVLGPGKNCRRSSVSFYQDIDYLGRVGNVLTTEEGLCHIGEWHSHHRIGLKRPSGGDENTVWTNMDRYGIYRFFLFIATIGISSYDVNIGCFLFEINPNTNSRKQVLKGEIRRFGSEESPFRRSVSEHLADGAESQNSLQLLKEFKSHGQETNFLKDSTGKRLHNQDEGHLEKKKAKLPENTEKEECHTREIPLDEEMEEPRTRNREDKPENIPTKDAEKSKDGQEMETQGNKFSSTPCATTDKNDNMQPGNQRPNFTEDNNLENLEKQPRPTLMTTKENIIDKHASTSIPKDANKCKGQYLGNEYGNQQYDLQEDNNPENLKNQPFTTPMTTKEIIPKGANKNKVHYIGNCEAKGKKGDLHPKESDDGQTTGESNSKEILSTKKIVVKSAENDDNSTKQSKPDSNSLDQDENAGKKESPSCEPQPLTSKPYDTKQNNIIQTSAISSKKEEGKFVEDTTSEEDDKPFKTSKYRCMPNIFRRRKDKRKKREKEEKKISTEKEQKEMEDKNKAEKEEKEEKEEKKRRKKIEKENKKRSKKQKKREMEEKKKAEKGEKEEKKRQQKIENEEKQKLKKNEKQESKKRRKEGRKEIKVINL